MTCEIIRDRATGRSRGFGFVEMASKAESENAIAQLNGHEIDGRELTVALAKPKQSRSFGQIPGEFDVDAYVGHSGRSYLT